MGYLTISIFKIHFQFLSYYYILTPTYPSILVISDLSLHSITLLLWCFTLLPLHSFPAPALTPIHRPPHVCDSSHLLLLLLLLFFFFKKKYLTIPLVLLIFFCFIFGSSSSFSLFIIFFSLQIHARILDWKANFFRNTVEPAYGLNSFSS